MLEFLFSRIDRSELVFHERSTKMPMTKISRSVGSFPRPDGNNQLRPSRSDYLTPSLSLSHFPSYDIGRSNMNSLITTGQCAPVRKHSWRRLTVGKSHRKHSTHLHRHDNRLSSSHLIPTSEMQKTLFLKQDHFHDEQDFVGFFFFFRTSRSTPAPFPCPHPSTIVKKKKKSSCTRGLMQPIYHPLPEQ